MTRTNPLHAMLATVVPFPRTHFRAWFRAMWPLTAGLVLLLLTLSPGQITEQGPLARLEVTRALWAHGSVFVDEVPLGLQSSMVETDSGWTTFYGIGQSLVFIPFDMVAAVVAHFIPAQTDAERRAVELAVLALVYLPVIAVMLWVSLSWMLREFGVQGGAASWLSIVYCISTFGFVYASRSLQDETLIGSLLCFAVAAMLHSSRTANMASAKFSGFCAGFAVLCRLNAVLALLPLVMLMFDRRSPGNVPSTRSRTVTNFALGALTPLALYLVFSYLRFGSFLTTGYDQITSGVHTNEFGAIRPLLAVQMLIGLPKGVLLLSPPLLLGLFALKQLRFERPLLWIGVSLMLLLSCMFYSTLSLTPDGGQGWGVRYLVHALVWLAYPMAVGIQSLATHRAGRVLVSVTLVLGLLTQLSAVQNVWGIDYYRRSGNPLFVWAWSVIAFATLVIWIWWFTNGVRGQNITQQTTVIDRRSSTRPWTQRRR